jgi:hypothetical protein
MSFKKEMALVFLFELALLVALAMLIHGPLLVTWLSIMDYCGNR